MKHLTQIYELRSVKQKSVFLPKYEDLKPGDFIYKYAAGREPIKCKIISTREGIDDFNGVKVCDNLSIDNMSTNYQTDLYIKTISEDNILMTFVVYSKASWTFGSEHGIWGNAAGKDNYDLLIKFINKKGLHK